MQNIINFFRGSCRLAATGPFPERFLNLCAQNGVPFWGVEWLEDGGVQLTVPHKDRRRAARLAEKAGCTLTPAGERGIPSFLARFRKRYALLVGLALSLLAVAVLSQFILTVEVEGNTTVPTAKILTELRRLGLRPGTYGGMVDEAMVAQQLLRRVGGLSWCAVNLKGTIAQVVVREAVKAPPLLDEKTLGDVVARAPGMVTHMEVLEGAALVKKGDTVLPGDILITGKVHLEAPKYSTVDLGWQYVKAQGRVYARTWRTLEAEIPLTADIKTPTGKEKSLWSLQLLGNRVNFYGNAGISYDRYDKITSVYPLRLPGGREMPLSLTRETAREYATQSIPIDPAAAEELLRTQLNDALTAQLDGRGEAVRTDYTVRQLGGKLYVKLIAECKEEIGKFVPFS